MDSQVEKLDNFWHIILSEFNRKVKAVEVARNICTVYGGNAIRESMAKKWFSHFKKDCFDISDTAHSGRPSGFDEDHLNIMIHVSVLENCQIWWTVTIPALWDICIQWASLKNRVYGYCMLLSQNHKNQWEVIRASLLARHPLACEQHRPFISSIFIVDEKWCLYANIRKRKELLSPNKKAKDNVIHLVEYRGCAVLQIASSRCNHHCWHLLPTAEMSCRLNPRKTTNNTAWIDATPRQCPPTHS